MKELIADLTDKISKTSDVLVYLNGILAKAVEIEKKGDVVKITHGDGLVGFASDNNGWETLYLKI